MSYENAPATKMLATRCCCCGRPLLDAVSVSVGIGPDCREKYGFNIEVPEDSRKAANAVIHMVAVNPKAANLPEACAKLTSLGFSVLAAKLIGKLAKVIVSEKDGRFAVKTPYNEAVVAEMRRIPGRRWEPTEKLNYFPADQKPALFALLVKHFEGEVAVGPKGVFIVGAKAAAPAVGAITAETVEAPAVLYKDMSYEQKGIVDAQEAAKEARKAAMDDTDGTVSAQAMYDAAVVHDENEDRAWSCGLKECNGGEGCDGERVGECLGYAYLHKAPVGLLPVVSDFTDQYTKSHKKDRYRN